jgi:Pyruvate/2-oxoacid:ferredoxin oxidoreductase delta subunit
MIRVCPYCGNECGGRSDGGDEVVDYCEECGICIEGATEEVTEEFYYDEYRV